MSRISGPEIAAEQIEGLVSWGSKFQLSNMPKALTVALENYDYMYGRVTVSEGEEEGHVFVTFVTGGWSDNEMILGTLDDGWFKSLYWDMSRRGGLVRYEVPADMVPMDIDGVEYN